MITLIVLIPIFGSLLISILSENNDADKSKLRKIALITSLVNFFISIIIWLQYVSNSLSTKNSLISYGQPEEIGISTDTINLGMANFQFVYEFDHLSFLHFNLGIDGISLYFVLLTTFITPICILSNWTDINKNLKYFLICFLLLETLQIAVFVVLDLLMFYIFFESVLIPLFIIVGIWGGSENKIRASYLLFLYTLAGSLFMLLAILYIYSNVGSTDFKYISLFT